MNNPPPAAATGAGVHARASTSFLTDIPPKRSDTSEVEPASRSISWSRRRLDEQTQLASLELAIEGRDLAGSCDSGFSCAYTNTIAWRGPTTPLPMENNPRVVFERMFGDSGSTDRRGAAGAHRDRPQHPRLGDRDRVATPAAGGSARAIA